jgi:hypothetical protein
MPCGQFSANALYFTIGILAFTLDQLLKRDYFRPEWKKKSVLAYTLLLRICLEDELTYRLTKARHGKYIWGVAYDREA